MAGNWKANILLGLTAFLFTFCFSIENNTWITALFRSGIGFVIFFIFGYVIRIVLSLIFSMKTTDPTEERTVTDKAEINFHEQNEEKQQWGEPSSFQSIPLNALHSLNQEIDPEKTENAIRAWTNQDQEG